MYRVAIRRGRATGPAPRGRSGPCPRAVRASTRPAFRVDKVARNSKGTETRVPAPLIEHSREPQP